MSDSNKVINEDYPGIVYDGTAYSTAEYAEDREFLGALYRTQNAIFDRSSPSWSQRSAETAYAAVQNPDGSIGHLKEPDTTSGSWTVWTGNEQRGVFNVMDFGAKGTGTDDDTAALTAAAQAAGEAGGGIVFCPAGRYLIYSVIRLYSNTTLLGEGKGQTTIAAHADLNGGPYKVGTKWYTDTEMIVNSQYDQTSFVPEENIYVRDLCVYGNGGANAGQDLSPPEDVTVNGGLISFQHVTGQGVFGCAVQSSANHGIDFFGTNVWQHTLQYGMFSVVDCEIDLLSDFTPPGSGDNSGFPIRAVGLRNGYVKGNVIGFNSLPGLKTNDAMDLPGSSVLGVFDNIMTMCTDGIGLNESYDVVIARNIMLECKGYGISSFATREFGSSRVVIKENVIVNSGNIGIWVAAGKSETLRTTTVISDNTIMRNGHRSSIFLVADGAICHGNIIDLSGTDHTAIECNAASLFIAMNIVRGGIAGSTGVHLHTGASAKVINNNLLGSHLPITCDDDGGDLSMLTGSIIRGNVGANPYGLVDSLPTSPTGKVTNNTPFDCVAFVSGGTDVSIDVQDTPTNLGSGTAFNVPTGASITVTYSGSGAPTVTWIGN